MLNERRVPRKCAKTASAPEGRPLKSALAVLRRLDIARLFSARRASAFAASLLALLASAGLKADQRYEVVPLHPGYEFGTEKALILDTVAGHLWIWVESPAVGKRDGGRYVIYQGQLEPGREMGDIVLQQQWPPDK